VEPNDWVAELEVAASRVGTIDSAFAADSSRHSRFVFEVGGVRADFSMQHVDENLLSMLVAFASERGVPGRRDAMLAGEDVNVTELRKVLHTAVRGSGPAPEVALAQRELDRALALAEALRSAGGPSVLVNIGIGGSHLGPAMACAAMRSRADGPECRFVSNIDPADLDTALTGLDPASTVFVVSSKTFTTQETMHNASRAREWVRASVGEAWTERFVAVTADPDRAVAWGVRPDRCLRFWDWVGGRFSVSSVIGLPIMVSAGPAAFREFLAGMAEMDAHFARQPLRANLPVVHGLVAWLNAVVLGRHSSAVVPYARDLSLLPAFLQQLVMESNGKSVTESGAEVTVPTSPVLWGAPGTDGQHAFFQLLHQGTRIVPVEFVGVREPVGSDRGGHDMLVANMLAQAAALASGRHNEHEPHRSFPGNRPSTTIFLETLSPRCLGAYVAMHEHSTAVQGWLWGIDSFDQWGVELGKETAGDLLPAVRGTARAAAGPATAAAIHWYRRD
jgi:glucose-6-phosphate isomerase